MNRRRSIPLKNPNRTPFRYSGHLVAGTVIGFFVLGSIVLHADDEPPLLPQGPLLLTSVKPEQLNPDYWIQKLSDPDQPVKIPKELEEFNDYIRSLIPQRMDIFKLKPVRAGKEITEEFEHVLTALKSRRLYDTDNNIIPKTFFDAEITPMIQSDAVPSKIKVRWGAAKKAAPVRALPSDVKLLEKPYDIEFDQLQFTLIKPWTPVAIFHESKDRKWFFIQAPYTRGWVHAKEITVFPSRGTLKKYVKSSRFLSVTGESISVFYDTGLQNPAIQASMGTVIPLKAQNPTFYTVWLPGKNSADEDEVVEEAYISKKSDVSAGYLPYTQANMIRQAFKLLASRYGWGGMYDGRDCSAFTHDVFLSLGVDMPRNSHEQAFVGTKLGFFNPFSDSEMKEQVLEEARPGITLLAMPHHMMIYIGKENGLYYVIHSTWAERIAADSDKKNRINQVVVSDLSLNGNSYLGSLFDRIVSMNEVA